MSYTNTTYDNNPELYKPEGLLRREAAVEGAIYELAIAIPEDIRTPQVATIADAPEAESIGAQVVSLAEARESREAALAQVEAVHREMNNAQKAA
jgi:hypothetical protein